MNDDVAAEHFAEVRKVLPRYARDARLALDRLQARLEAAEAKNARYSETVRHLFGGKEKARAERDEARADAERPDGEREFLDASIAVWREIDQLSKLQGGYRGLPSSGKLRQQERAAWERYRAALAADRKMTEEEEA